MSLQILKCKVCNSFSLSEHCSCGGNCINPLPPKFSPEDTYGRFRREAKKEERINSNLI